VKIDENEDILCYTIIIIIEAFRDERKCRKTEYKNEFYIQNINRI
jgi:hypothetical protein